MLTPLNDDQIILFFYMYRKARAAAEDAATPKDICYALPGWGQWAGPNITMSKKIKEKFT